MCIPEQNSWYWLINLFRFTIHDCFVVPNKIRWITPLPLVEKSSNCPKFRILTDEFEANFEQQFEMKNLRNLCRITNPKLSPTVPTHFWSVQFAALCEAVLQSWMASHYHDHDRDCLLVYLPGAPESVEEDVGEAQNNKIKSLKSLNPGLISVMNRHRF